MAPAPPLRAALGLARHLLRPHHPAQCRTRQEPVAYTALHRTGGIADPRLAPGCYRLACGVTRQAKRP